MSSWTICKYGKVMMPSRFQQACAGCSAATSGITAGASAGWQRVRDPSRVPTEANCSPPAWALCLPSHPLQPRHHSHLAPCILTAPPLAQSNSCSRPKLLTLLPCFLPYTLCTTLHSSSHTRSLVLIFPSNLGRLIPPT